MTVPLRLAISAAIVLVWMQFDMPVRAAGPSGVLYACAKVEEVLSPVEIKAKLLENKRVVKVRLQGLRSTTAKGKDRSSALRSRGDLRQGVYAIRVELSQVRCGGEGRGTLDKERRALG